jgi:hypothetical protein
MVMAVDSPIPAEVLDEVVARAEMRDARAIILDRNAISRG